MNKKNIPLLLIFIFLLATTMFTGTAEEKKIEQKVGKKVEQKEEKKEESNKEAEVKKDEKKAAQSELKFDYEEAALDDISKEQLRYFLQVPPLIEKINAGKEAGSNVKVLRRRAARLLKKAAEIARDTPQKEYLDALSADIKTHDFSSSQAKWLNQTGHKIDIIIHPRSKKKSRELKIFILLEHTEHTKKIEKYITAADKMLEKTPIREGLVPIDAALIAPIIVADVVYSFRPDQFMLAFPAVFEKDRNTNFKIVFFRNVLESYFNKFVKPLSEKALTKKWAELVDFDSYLSNIIMHRVAHYIGPIFVDQKSDKVVLVKDKLKDLFFDIEEIRAEAAAIYSTQVLIDEKLISEEQEKKIYSTYITSLLSTYITDPDSKTALPTLIQINHQLKSEGIIFDLNAKKLKIDKEQLAQSVRRLMLMTAQVEGSGNYEEADQMLKGNLSSPSDELKELLINIKRKPRKLPKKKDKPKGKEEKKEEKEAGSPEKKY